jgi:hypothetical protein
MAGTGKVASLELFDWGVRVRSRGLFCWLPLKWEVRYDELVKAQLVRFPIANRGVLLLTDGSVVPLVFTTFRGSEILDQLETHRVPIDRSVARLRLADL